MKELAAYLLLTLSGATPSADKIKETLKAVGIETTDEEISRLTTSLEGKDLDTIIAEGRKKLVNIGGGGGGGAAPAAAGAAAPAAGGAAKPAKEEKKVRVEGWGQVEAEVGWCESACDDGLRRGGGARGA